MNGNSINAYFGNLEQLAIQNTNFRQVLFTGDHSQLVLMCLQPNEEIGSEVHPDVDQFFRIEEGEANFIVGSNEEHLVKAGEAVVVPAGTQHNVINTSATAYLKLYTIYSPANHPAGTIHKTKAEAMAAHGEPVGTETVTADVEPTVETTTEPTTEIPVEPTAEPTDEPTVEPTPAPEIPTEPVVPNQPDEENTLPSQPEETAGTPNKSI